MAAGCKKADRNRKSGQNARYIAERRQEVNKRRRMATHAERCQGFKKMCMATPRGSARNIRRRPLQEAYAERMAEAA